MLIIIGLSLAVLAISNTRLFYKPHVIMEIGPDNTATVKGIGKLRPIDFKKDFPYARVKMTPPPDKYSGPELQKFRIELPTTPDEIDGLVAKLNNWFTIDSISGQVVDEM